MKLRTRYRLHQSLVFFLTFLSYGLYHAGRQPSSTAKAALNPNVNNATQSINQSISLGIEQLGGEMWRSNRTIEGMLNQSFFDQSMNQSIYHQSAHHSINQSINDQSVNDQSLNDDIHSGFSPFDDPIHGGYWLSLIDTLYLVGYAVGMLIAGPIGDRVRLDLFLFFGMFMVGVCLCINGAFFWLNVHSMVGWCMINFFGGVFQASGWPSNVTVMTRWFPHATLGSILGIWSTQQPIGNVIGKYFGAGLQQAYGWPFNYIGLGLLLIGGGLCMLFFLENSPVDAFDADELRKIKSGVFDDEDSVQEQYQSLNSPDNQARKLSEDDFTSINQSSVPSHLPISVHSPFTGEHFEDQPVNNQPIYDDPHHQPIVDQPIEHPHLSFLQCLFIPGVIEFGFSLFFSKFLTYALMFWLPFYLTKSLSYEPDTASTLSTAFDYGGILGAIIAGVGSDWNKKRGWTTFLMSLACIPFLWLYQLFGDRGWFANVALLFLVGIVVNGPYSLITSAVCSDLGRHPVLNGNPHAMSTVTGIIDTFGSVGATFNGVVVASVAARLGWTAVFYSLMIVAVLCCVSIIRIVKHELFGEKGVVYGQPTLQRGISDVSIMESDDDDDMEDQHIKILHKDVSIRN